MINNENHNDDEPRTTPKRYVYVDDTFIPLSDRRLLDSIYREIQMLLFERKMMCESALGKKCVELYTHMTDEIKSPLEQAIQETINKSIANEYIMGDKTKEDILQEWGLDTYTKRAIEGLPY